MWSLEGFTFVIPEGLRLLKVHGPVLEDVASGSWLRLPTWGPAEEWGRFVTGDNWREVNARFDQIVASAQRPSQSERACADKAWDVRWRLRYFRLEDRREGYTAFLWEKCGIAPLPRERDAGELVAIIACLAAFGCVVTLAGARQGRGHIHRTDQGERPRHRGA